MARTVQKAEALELLEQNRRELLGSDGGCMMCALSRQAAAQGTCLASNEHGVVILDRFGSRYGHVLVISRDHREEPADLGWPAYVELQRLAYEASVAIKTAFSPARTFLAVLGTSAELPMSFSHFHIHVLPVYESDERARPAYVFSWSAGVLVYADDEAFELSARLRAAWPQAGLDRASPGPAGSSIPA